MNSQALAQELNRQGFSSASLTGPNGPVLFSAIPALLRLLLVTDGTVTQALEAYFNTQLQVQLLQQGRSSVPQSFALQPNISIADPMLRRVQLVRSDTQSVLVQAESIIALDLLPLELADGLLAGKLGIGDLIRAQSLDTYRQLLDLGISQRAGRVGVWRTYAICREHQALMQVQEWFPWDVFEKV